MKRSDKLKYTLNPKTLEKRFFRLLENLHKPIFEQDVLLNNELVDIFYNIPMSTLLKIFKKMALLLD